MSKIEKPRNKQTVFSDDERLDWLEMMANKPEGILLHDGKNMTGRLGLGLESGHRKLRQAIDQAMSLTRVSCS